MDAKLIRLGLGHVFGLTWAIVLSHAWLGVGRHVRHFSESSRQGDAVGTITCRNRPQELRVIAVGASLQIDLPRAASSVVGIGCGTLDSFCEFGGAI